jgi:hypothetical protein
MPGPSACLLPSVSDQVNQHDHQDTEHHGDSEEIAEDFVADLAPGHSWSATPCNPVRSVPIKIGPHFGAA